MSLNAVSIWVIAYFLFYFFLNKFKFNYWYGIAVMCETSWFGYKKKSKCAKSANFILGHPGMCI